MVDKNWVWDVDFSRRQVGVTYDFDAEALKVDEGDQRLLDEVSARVMERVRTLEEACLSATARQSAFEDLQVQYFAEREPIVRAYSAFLALYQRPYVITSMPGLYVSGVS